MADAYLDRELLGGMGGQPGLISGAWHCQLAAQQGLHVAQPLSDPELLTLPFSHLLHENRTSSARAADLQCARHKLHVNVNNNVCRSPPLA